jgi:PST family polysaccharide transporter
MLYCLSEALFPIWYFQGIEKMKYITFINVTTRLASCLLIFIFVKLPDDYVFVPLILGIGTISGSIIGLYAVFKKHQQKFLIPSVPVLRYYISKNFPLFISSVSSQIYVNANKLIIGSFLGMKEIAIYDVADKIVNLIKVPVTLIGQTLFPRVSRDKNTRFVKTVMIMVFFIYVIIYAFIFLFTKEIIFLFTGSHSEDAVILLRLLATSVLLICVALFYAELLLIPFGFLKEYTRMRIMSLIVYLSLIGILIAGKFIGLYELAGVIIFVETFVLVDSYFLCKKNKIL